MQEAESTNPVLVSSSLPHGLPDFASISDDDFLPAFSEATAVHLAEIDAIVSDPAPASFANTIEALERSGELLSRAAGIFFNLVGADTNPQRNEISQVLATQLAEHSNAIALNPDLFARIENLYERKAELDLDEPSLRLLDKRYRDAVRAGAALDDAGKQRMREISARLAVLETTFSQRVLDDANASAVHVATEAELDGLSRAAIEAARRRAAEAGRDGYLLGLELPTSQSALTKLADPAVRRKVFDASVARCGRGNDYDTSSIVLEIVRLRAERAELLGYRTHADYVIDDQTAPSIAAVEELLGALTSAAVSAAETEVARLAKLAGGTEITASDMTYWLERERIAGASVNLSEFTEYCELDSVLVNGVFYAAGVLYGLRFVPRTDLAGYHPDVRVWEVLDADGDSIGLFLGDFYARPSKRGGAWMNNIVDQSGLLKTQPVIVNVLNIARPADGEPVLLSLNEINTLFHEFGHTLHGMLSAVYYPSQSGTSVPRDFVEFPSQVNEMWALHPDVLGHYAKHHRTGEPIPAELAEAASASAGVESAHATIEYLGAALLDLAWHKLSAAKAAVVSNIDDFESEALSASGIASGLVPPRYKTRYFNHIFGGGYSAGYYSYIWSEVLDAETEQWFLARGGLTADSGRTFASATLRRGDSVDLIAAHEQMVGHHRDVMPLLRRRGLGATI